jgi:hypothetical protein
MITGNNFKKYDVKVILFGHHGVGKKSFVKRLKAINSSEIKEIPKEYQEPSKQEIKSMLNSKDYHFGNEKEYKVFHKNKYLRDKLCSFKKIYTVEQFQIDFSCKITTKASPLLNSENKTIVDELDSTEKAYNLKFNVVKKDAKEIVQETNNSNIEKGFDKTLFCFVFMWDFSNFESFEKIKIYYEEMNKLFKLDSSEGINNLEIATIFIGNKIDAKLNINLKEDNPYENFFKQIPFNYYEISTANYFNFSKFFKSMFATYIAPRLNDACCSSYFNDKLNNILFMQKT